MNRIARQHNLAHGLSVGIPVKPRTRRALRNACHFERLEDRTLMSSTVPAPTGLTALASSPSAVQLNWTDNTTAVTSYGIWRSANGGAFTEVGTLSAKTANSFSDTSVSSGQTYQYTIQAVNGSTASDSNFASATTPLKAATGLTASATTTAVTLNWTPNDSDALGFYVFRSTNGVNFSQIATVSGSSAHTYIDATGATGTAYYYTVMAVNTVAGSAASNVVTAVKPLVAPTGLSASVSGPSISLNWTPNDSNALGFYVYRSTNGVNFSQIATISGATANSYTDATAAAGTSYYYLLVAVNTVAASGVSNVANVVTPLATPTNLAATPSGSSVDLSWTANDPTALGFYLYRSTDDVNFSQIATISGATANTYVDNTGAAGTTYYYDIVAVNMITASGVSNTASASLPAQAQLGTPSGLTAQASGNSVQLNWTAATGATGYYVLRSTNNVNFTQIATLGAVTAYTDNSTTSGTLYYYQIEACNGSTTSPACASATATTPLSAPTALGATVSGSSIVLNWTDEDPSATGYYVLRSTNDSTFTSIGTVNGVSSNSYTDPTVTSGTTYYYEVEAFDAATTSAASGAASQVVPETQENTVSITSRYSDDELVVNSTGTDDTISVSESAGTFTIDADGQNFTDASTPGGLFIYTRGGTDTIDIASTVTSFVTLETIDGALTTIDSAGTDVTAWIDSTDSYTGTGDVHKVASFAGGVSKAYGAALANPSDAGATAAFSASLFGTGPVEGDANQGGSGDCYLIASLAAFAQQDPNLLVQSAVDMGDGTYVVQFMNGSTPTFVRVSNQFSTGGFDGYEYAHPGANGTIWAAVIEKAFAYYRTDANTYASIASGWMGEVYGDFGLSSEEFVPSALSQSILYSEMSSDLAAGDSITLGTSNSAPNLVSDHAYTLVSVSDVGGNMTFTVRNPWGFSGDSLENSQGIATLTYAEFCNNFIAGCLS
jgi:fibronectin type 3 domain-containing protein